jgi:hypothetical protein
LAAEGAAVLVTDVKDEVNNAVVRNIVEGGRKATSSRMHALPVEAFVPSSRSR